MKTYFAIPASLALVLSVSACDRAATPADGNAAPAAEASASNAESVKQSFADFNAAIAAKDVDAIKAFYASDAVMIIPDQAPFKGVDAIAADYQGFASDAAGKYVSGEETTYVSSGGDLAYGEVNYQTTYTNPKTKAVETADRYNFTVYKKQPDGSWKVIRDINAPLPKAS
ncbi:MAG: SgcJ/EcaC family oxidoreductase [Sphingomicrobium sp.]